MDSPIAAVSDKPVTVRDPVNGTQGVCTLDGTGHERLGGQRPGAVLPRTEDARDEHKPEQERNNQ
jgi:hypothetical protein